MIVIARGLLVLLMLACSLKAWATTTTCTNNAGTFTQTGGSNPWSGSLANGQQVLTGTLTLSATCNGPTQGTPASSNLGIQIVFGTNPVQTGVPGVYGYATGTPTLSGTCTTIGSSQSTGSSSINFFNSGSSNCTETMTISLAFKINGSTGIGNGSLFGGSVWSNVSSYQNNTYSVLTAGSYPVVSFSGVKACTVSGASTWISLNLPQVSIGALSGNGKTAGRTPFLITLSGCTFPSSSYVATATWSFTQGSAANLLSNTASSPAANVYLQILDSALLAISNGGQSAINVTSSGSVSSTFYVQYYATGVAGAGGVQGVATFTMTYL